jgi:hypothetical protein
VWSEMRVLQGLDHPNIMRPPLFPFSHRGNLTCTCMRRLLAFSEVTHHGQTRKHLIPNQGPFVRYRYRRLWHVGFLPFDWHVTHAYIQYQTPRSFCNPGEREMSALRRLRGRLGNLLACAKCSNAHTCAKPAANDMHYRRALIVITEQSTIPVRVFIVAPNGVAATSTEITSRSSIPVSTPT